MCQKQCQAYFASTSHDRVNVSLNGQRLIHDSHPVDFDIHWTGHYPKTPLDQDYCKAEEQKQSPLQIGRLGCKRCNSPFFCVSPLLFSRGVLLSSMVQVITYRPSRRAAQQHHAPHHRNTAPYTGGVATSSRQYCTCAANLRRKAATDVLIEKMKKALRDANTARALAVVRFGHRPPARCKHTNPVRTDYNTLRRS